MAKVRATLGGIPIAATGPVTWSLRVGTAPFTTVYSVHKNDWDALKPQRGKLLDLVIRDARGQDFKVRGVTILHEMPSDSPHRVRFLVADRRWIWPFTMVCRDYNVTKRTGERSRPDGQGGEVPEILVTVDEYRYRAHSLRKGKERWTSKQVVTDVLGIVCRQSRELWASAARPQGSGQGWDQPFLYQLKSWPIREEDGGGGASEIGSFTIQNVSLRDSGDVALSRVLSYVPGAQVMIDTHGKAVVFDGTDIQATRRYFEGLPPGTYDGDRAIFCDRSRIRPREVLVHYQRELEILFDYQDDYNPTQTGSESSRRDKPTLVNVLPTVDPTTEIREYDPETNKTVTKTVLQGTWVEARVWLDAMNNTRPPGSAEWTFETIRKFWLKGDLEGVLGGDDVRGVRDVIENANVAHRVQALRQHFRQTFRVSRRYMERLREIRPVRVGILDPVTGARAPAPVWGQACMIPSNKGGLVAHRIDPEKAFVYINVSQYPEDGENVLEKVPSPALVEIVDEELGIIRIDWQQSPYGVTAEYVPCHVVDGTEAVTAASRNLGDQDLFPMGPGMRIEGGTNGLMLAKKMKFKLLLTAVPAAPNNGRQLHQVKVSAADAASLLAREYSVQGGYGPPLELFIPPGEATARYALTDPNKQDATLDLLLGLNANEQDASNGAGPAGHEPAGLPPGASLDGYSLMNADIELKPHAQAVAIEAIVRDADDVFGNFVTEVPAREATLVGTMNSATVQIAPAPSGKTQMVHDFPGRQRPISRFALLPDAARQLILGTLPFGK